LKSAEKFYVVFIVIRITDGIFLRFPCNLHLILLQVLSFDTLYFCRMYPVYVVIITAEVC